MLLIDTAIDLSGKYVNKKGVEYSRGDISIYMLNRKQKGRTPRTYLLLKESHQYISSLYKIPDSTESFFLDFQGIQYVLTLTEEGFDIRQRQEVFKVAK
jgi:hypothetical protein